MLSFFKGDTININVNFNEDITGWKIRAEIYPSGSCGCGGSTTSTTSSIKLATSNSGGSIDEIDVVDAPNGKALIQVAKNITTNFDSHSILEIEIETADAQIFTLKHIPIDFKRQHITWETPS